MTEPWKPGARREGGLLRALSPMPAHAVCSRLQGLAIPGLPSLQLPAETLSVILEPIQAPSLPLRMLTASCGSSGSGRPDTRDLAGLLSRHRPQACQLPRCPLGKQEQIPAEAAPRPTSVCPRRREHRWEGGPTADSPSALEQPGLCALRSSPCL